MNRRRIFCGVFFAAVALACNAVVPPPAETESAPPAAPARELIDARGKSPAQLNAEVLPLLTRAGWDADIWDNGELFISAPPPATEGAWLSYFLKFHTNEARRLAVVRTELYLLPDIGGFESPDALFRLIQNDFPNVAVAPQPGAQDLYEFRGTYSFGDQLDAADFLDFLNLHNASMEKLLSAYPYFSKQ